MLMVSAASKVDISWIVYSRSICCIVQIHGLGIKRIIVTITLSARPLVIILWRFKLGYLGMIAIPINSIRDVFIQTEGPNNIGAVKRTSILIIPGEGKNHRRIRVILATNGRFD